MKRIILIIFTINFSLMAYSLEELCLKEAIKIGLKNSLDIKLSKNKLEDASLQVKEAYSNLWPRVSLSGSYLRYPEEISFEIDGNKAIIQKESSSFLNLNVEQPLFQYRVKHLGKAAKYNLESSKELYKNDEQELIYKISELYYMILASKDSYNIYNESLKNVKSHVETIKTKFEVGDFPETALLEANYRLENSELELLNAEKSINNLKEILSILIEFDSDFVVIDSDINKIEHLDKTEWLNKVKENNALLKSIQNSIDTYKEYKKSIYGEYIPGISSFYNVDHNLDEATVFSPSETTWILGVKFNWNVFERGNRKTQIKKVDNQISTFKLQKKNLIKGIKTRINTLVNEMDSIDKSIKVHEQKIKLATKNYELRQEQFNVGLASNTELLDANTFLEISKLLLNIDKYKLKLNYLKLLKEAGLLSVEAVQ